MYCTIQVAKTKALISFAVTAKLICFFVFTYGKSWFSHDLAHTILAVKTKASVSLLGWAANICLCFVEYAKSKFLLTKLYRVVIVLHRIIIVESYLSYDVTLTSCHKLS